MRNFTKYILAPILVLTGYRFSKDFRYGTTAFHRMVYALINTVGSNCQADVICFKIINRLKKQTDL